MTFFQHLISYQRRAQITPSLLEDTRDLDPPPLDSHTIDPSSSSPSLDCDHIWFDALRKSICSTCNRLSLPYSSCVFSLSTIIVPNNIILVFTKKALDYTGW